MLVSLVLFVVCSAMNNGVARKPPMGWLAWERFRCNTDCTNFPETCIGEKLFLEQGERLSADGWKDVGYNLVNIDDCWALKKRDSNNMIVADPARFPTGIKSIADKLHGMGLKLGIYGDMGTHTCAGYPGSMGYEAIDAKTFASWEVDMLKYDGCYSNETQQEIGYPAMSKALNSTGRPIIYACSWPAYQGGLPPQVDYKLLGEICNLWRNYGDIQDSWDDIIDIANWWGDHSDVLVPAAGPGRWNDPDMLIGGNYALTVNQAEVQFGLWSIMAAPLFLSTDLREISPEMTKVLQNTAVIAINQDSLCIQGKRVLNETSPGILKDMSVWVRPLVNNEFAVASVSYRRDGKPQPIHFTLKEAGLKMENSYLCADLFDENHDTTTFGFTQSISLLVPPDSIIMWRCYPQKFLSPEVARDFDQLQGVRFTYL